MATFRPYKYIKEFYNPDRLVLPAIRDQLINTIFIGKSDTASETLLDNQDYPFLDLWRMCINHFKYSFFETIRGELIVVPDMMSCLPPMNNIILPDEYVHYGRRVKLRGIVTRYYDMGFDTVGGTSGGEVMGTIVAGTQAFVAPTTDIQPMMGDIIKAECTGEEIKSSEEDDGFIAFRQVPLPEEFHYGATYYTGDGEALLRAGESLAVQNSGSSISGDGLESSETFDLREEYDNFHKLNVLYKYFLTRLQSQKTENIRLTFTPRLVAGLPCLLLSRTGKHIFGLITSLSHTVDASGLAETLINVEYQTLYDDASKRPLYLYRDRNAELDELKEAGAEQEGYMWKNYFILSNDFRDKYVGEKMYKNILCDDIPETDYNTYAKDFKNKLKSDYSILGVHNVFTSPIETKSKNIGVTSFENNSGDPIMSSDKVVTGTAGGASNRSIGGSGSASGRGESSGLNYLEYPPLEEWRIKAKLLEFYQRYAVHPGFDWTMINTPCKKLNVNPILIAAICQKESWGGTNGSRSIDNHNPGNVGNTNERDNRYFETWTDGWAECVNFIHRRIHKLHRDSKDFARTINNLAAVGDDGNKDPKYPFYASPIGPAKSWAKDINQLFKDNGGFEGFL